MKAAIAMATFLLTALRLCAAEPVHVALIGTGDGSAAKEAISLAEGKLSEVPGIQLVERSSVDLIFRELKTNAVFGDEAQRARMGQLLGADYFVWLAMPGGTLEVADAQSGESVEKKQLDVQSAQGMADAICAEVRALKAPLQANPSAVAFTISRTPENPDNEALITAVMQQLQSVGVPVLHRRYIDTVIAEHLWQEKGMAGSVGTVRPLLGARFLIGTRFEKSSLDVGVMDAKTGRRIAQHLWTAPTSGTIVDWIRDVIRNPPAAVARNKPDAADVIQPETLEPFYEGILLHNQGCYIEAADLLRATYETDRRSLPALRWLQSCYRLAGFTEISASIDNYLQAAKEKGNDWLEINRPKAVNGASGAALLGLTIDHNLPPALNGPLTMVLIDALHDSTDKPVLLTADIARLRAEYDVLTGMENVQGTTWSEAPPLLPAEGFTAHLESGPDGSWKLRLCGVRELDPTQINDHVVDLSHDATEWRKQIADGMRKLLMKDASGAGAWQPPKPVITESEDQLQKSLAADYNDATLLKLLLLDCEQLDQLHKFPKDRNSAEPFAKSLRTGIEDWIWAHIPRTSAQWPWIDIQHIEARHKENLKEYIPLLKDFVERNHVNPAGAVAQFNLLLYELNESNIEQTQAQIDALLPEFRKMPEKQITPQRIHMIEDMRDWLRCAMGQPVTNAANLKPCGTIGHPQVLLPNPWLAPSSGHTTVIKKIREWAGDDSLQAARCKLDVAFYHSVLVHEDIPVSLMKRVIEEHAKEPDLLSYLMVGYGHDFFDRKEIQPDEIADVAAIYARFVDVLSGLLDAKPALLGAFDTALILDTKPKVLDQLLSDPAFREARTRLSRAVVQAMIDGRFRDGENGDYCMLLLDRAGASNDPECERFLRLRAERSWDTNPLTDQFWAGYMHWRGYGMSQADRTSEFVKHLPGLHQLGENKPWSIGLFELHCQFIWGLFADGQYEQVREPLEELVAAKAGDENIRISELRANALYLLAKLDQHDGDRPAALRTAQSVLDEIGDRDAPLFGYVYFSHRGWSRDSNLKSIVTEYIGKLRADPNLPFKNPFSTATAATPTPEKTPATTPVQTTTAK